MRSRSTNAPAASAWRRLTTAWPTPTAGWPRCGGQAGPAAQCPAPFRRTPRPPPGAGACWKRRRKATARRPPPNRGRPRGGAAGRPATQRAGNPARPAQHPVAAGLRRRGCWSSAGHLAGRRGPVREPAVRGRRPRRRQRPAARRRLGRRSASRATSWPAAAVTLLACLVMPLNLWFYDSQGLITIKDGGHLWVAALVCCVLYAVSASLLRDPMLVYVFVGGVALTGLLLLADQLVSRFLGSVRARPLSSSASAWCASTSSAPSPRATGRSPAHGSAWRSSGPATPRWPPACCCRAGAQLTGGAVLRGLFQAALRSLDALRLPEPRADELVATLAGRLLALGLVAAADLRLRLLRPGGAQGRRLHPPGRRRLPVGGSAGAQPGLLGVAGLAGSGDRHRSALAVDGPAGQPRPDRPVPPDFVPAAHRPVPGACACASCRCCWDIVLHFRAVALPGLFPVALRPRLAVRRGAWRRRPSPAASAPTCTGPDGRWLATVYLFGGGGVAAARARRACC